MAVREILPLFYLRACRSAEGTWQIFGGHGGKKIFG
jgi:hypothetical protein